MAQFFTDFSQDTINAFPSGWTEQWELNGGKTVVAGGEIGGKRFRFIASSGAVTAASLNSVNGTANTEILALVRTESASTQPNGIIARGSGGALTKNGYGARLHDNAGTKRLQVYRWLNDSFSSISTFNFAWVQDVFYYIRFSVQGTVLKAKIWELGATEPAAWQIGDAGTVTDANLASGWVGYGGQTGNAHTVDYMAVGTAGDVAPTPGTTGTPLPTPVPTVTLTHPTTSGGTDGSVVVSWPAVTGAATYDVEFAAGLNQTSGFTLLQAGNTTRTYTHANLAAGDRTYGVTAKP